MAVVGGRQRRAVVLAMALAPLLHVLQSTLVGHDVLDGLHVVDVLPLLGASPSTALALGLVAVTVGVVAWLALARCAWRAASVPGMRAPGGVLPRAAAGPRTRLVARDVAGRAPPRVAT